MKKIIIGVLISDILTALDMKIPLYADITGLAVFTAVMFFAIMLTSVRPTLSLRKMNTAELLKRE